MISKLDLIRNREFVCPNCGKRISIDDAVLNSVLVEENSDLEFRGNHYVDKIHTSFVRLRFCPDCKNVRLRNKIFRHVSYFIIGPVFVLGLMSLFNWRNMFSWSGYFLGMCLLFIFYVPAVKLFREVFSPALNKSILKRAQDGNAIVGRFE